MQSICQYHLPAVVDDRLYLSLHRTIYNVLRFPVNESATSFTDGISLLNNHFFM